MLLHVVSLFFGLALADLPQHIPAPLTYIMPSESLFAAAKESSIAHAHLDCSNLVNAQVEICAELPLNWMWSADHGYVYLNIYNNRTAATSLGKPLNSTGKPGTGAAVPKQCTTVNQWPGGDLYIRIDANNYAPIKYVVSAKVTAGSPPIPSRHKPREIAKFDGDIELQGIATVRKSIPLEYDHQVLISIDTCYAADTEVPIMTTSIIASSGTLIHYVCDGLPCSPDATTVKCSSPTPMPIETCNAQFSPSHGKAYIYIHATGGDLTPNNTFVAEFKFAATFRTR